VTAVDEVTVLWKLRIDGELYMKDFTSGVVVSGLSLCLANVELSLGQPVNARALRNNLVPAATSDKAFMRAWLNNPGAGVRAAQRPRAGEVLT
jgi:hypothetical protein